MSDCMQFPDTWEEFEQAYGFEDKKEIYTNGSRLIQSFRVKQWLDHIAEPERKTFHVIDKTTGKEADPYEIALNEDWAKSLCYCDMEGFAILEDGTLILADECDRFEFIQENDRFEIVWDEVNDEDA